MTQNKFLEDLKEYCERNHDMTVVLDGEKARSNAPVSEPTGYNIPIMPRRRHLAFKRWCSENGLKCIDDINFDEYKVMKMTPRIPLPISGLQFEEGQG